MNALVTGATGFIGRRLVMELARRGWRVACLVRPTSDTRPLRSLPVDFVTGALDDTASLSAAVAGRDCVFHLAGVVQAVDEKDFTAVNTRGTGNLVAACIRSAPGLRRFIYVSSIAAAGPNASVRPSTEADEPRPASAYGRSKLAAERIVLGAGAALPATVVRPPNVIGPGSRELRTAAGLLRMRLSPAIGDDRPRTSLIDVDDLARAVILAAENPRSVGETYFVTDGRAYSWREITTAVADELGIEGLLIRIPFGVQLLAARFEEFAARLRHRPPRLTREIVRAARDSYWIFDGSKIERELGFKPRFGLRDSVRRALEDL